MILAIIGQMGTGKTLLASALAKLYAESVGGSILANYRLKLPRFIYCPSAIFDPDPLRDAMLIFDDFYALSNAEALIGLIVNRSRKAGLMVVMTLQYYSMLPRSLRALSFFLFPRLKGETLFVSVSPPSPDEPTVGPVRFRISHIFDYIKEIYDSAQIVDQVTSFDKIQRIRELAGDDIEKMHRLLEFAFSSKAERREARKVLGLREKEIAEAEEN